MRGWQTRRLCAGGCALTTFTIWVANEGRTLGAHVGVYDAPDVIQAIEQALHKAALDWSCHPDTLSVLGIAEGDLTVSKHGHE